MDLDVDPAARDELALETMIRPLLRPGFRLAYLLLRDREAAEDAVQEAALKCWRKLARLRPGSDPKPWFLGFVANECRNARRSKWSSVLKIGDPEAVPREPPSDEGDPDLARALASLSHADRVVVLLRYFNDMTPDEIGKATGMRTSAVRSRLYRAVKKLRPKLVIEEDVIG